MASGDLYNTEHILGSFAVFQKKLDLEKCYETEKLNKKYIAIFKYYYVCVCRVIFKSAVHTYKQLFTKGVVHFQIKSLLIIYSPKCHPRCPCLSFLSRKETFGIFVHIMDFSGNQTVQGPKDSFSTNCELFKGL